MEKFNIECKDYSRTQKCDFFSFRPEIPFLGKFDPKNQNCQFKRKFGTWTNSNMQNSMMFTFSVFDHKYRF